MRICRLNSISELHLFSLNNRTPFQLRSVSDSKNADVLKLVRVKGGVGGLVKVVGFPVDLTLEMLGWRSLTSRPSICACIYIQSQHDIKRLTFVTRSKWILRLKKTNLWRLKQKLWDASVKIYLVYLHRRGVRVRREVGLLQIESSVWKERLD